MIKIKCVACGEELEELGAILLSPPNFKGYVKKRHLCRHCYKMQLKFIKVEI